MRNLLMIEMEEMFQRVLEYAAFFEKNSISSTASIRANFVKISI